MNLALFDFDGTITTREMFADFMVAAVPPARLAVGRVVLAPVVAGYKLRVISGSLIRSAVVGFGLRGLDERDVVQAGQRFARDTLPGVLRPEAMDQIQWHRARGDRIVVVSGALDVYLSHWCEQHGLELMCSRLESLGGRLTGRYRGAQCVGEEKARRVRERYRPSDFEQVYAYGDTPEDHALLAMASRRYYRWREVA